MPRKPAYEKSYVDPSWAPRQGEVMAFGGAQVGWDRGREACDPWTCRRCGGKGLIFDATDADAAISIPFRFDAERYAIVMYDDDPLKVSSSAACLSCNRWTLDDWLAHRAEREALPASA